MQKSSGLALETLKRAVCADRLVDIITDGTVALGSEMGAEEHFEEIIATLPKYSDNDLAFSHYVRYHREIQALIASFVDGRSAGSRS